MSCGCAADTDKMRTRAIMCETCVHPLRNERWSALTCNGKPVQAYILGAESCPRGRHPDDKGMVTWLRIRWYGAPFPLRYVCRFWLTKQAAGCGCIARLKDGWTKARKLFRFAKMKPTKGKA